MLLVLISLAVATILATAYLASRDNSTVIGENASSGSSAKWAALACLKSGVAVLETETDWRTNHTNGVVFTNGTLAGASVDLTFLDLTTGNPPTADTTDVKIVATARSGGMSETITANAHVPLPEKEADLDLSEFAVFGKDKVTIKDTSLLTRWTTSPRNAIGKQLAIGTSNKNAGAVTLSDYAVALDSVVYKVKGASSILVSNSGPGVISTQELPDTVVVPDPPTSGVSRPSAATLSLWSNFSRNSGATFTVTNNRNIKALTIASNAAITLRGPVTVTVGETMAMTSGGRLIIQGDVKLVVFGKITMDNNTSIDLEDGAKLSMWAADDITIAKASINQAGKGTERKTDGTAEYMDPSRFVLYSYDNASKNWVIDDGATIKGRIYAPYQVVKVRNTSAVYGGIVGREVELDSGGSVFYDPALDTRSGYTTTNSALYGSDGLLDPAVKTIATLDDTAVDVVEGLLGLLAPAPAPSPVPVGDPTPRTIDVTYEIVGVSSDIAKWEQKGTMLVDAPIVPKDEPDITPSK